MINYNSCVFDSDEYSTFKSEMLNLNWCRPPSGIPGNKTPRYVSVLGDADGKYGNTIAYPMFQTCKDCSNVYKLNPMSNNLQNLTKKLKKMVKDVYGRYAINVDSMFNVAVCNYYTQPQHKINAHRDDERWLDKNELDINGNPIASIIASFTLYPDFEYDEQPGYFRKFEIYDDQDGRWNEIELKNNSILFFSNHQHRCKELSKKYKNIRRINVTFRTITTGLLGMIGFSNFYRYMSLPIELHFNKSKYSTDKVDYFINSIIESNKFNGSECFTKNLKIFISDKKNTGNQKKLNIDYLNLPRYVKPLCSSYNLTKYSSLDITIFIKILFSS